MNNMFTADAINKRKFGKVHKIKSYFLYIDILISGLLQRQENA